MPQNCSAPFGCLQQAKGVLHERFMRQQECAKYTYITKQQEDFMGQNIFVGILCILALAIGIWGVWFENGGSFRKEDPKETGTAAEEKREQK